MARQGIFITFEGPEGSGKSTQMLRLKKKMLLRERSKGVVCLREPGGTRIGESIRMILLDKRFTEMDPTTELLLYLAARSQISRQKILPALRKGVHVLCDRYEDSTMAYQGYARGLPLSDIRFLNQVTRGALKPDLTILLDLDPKDGFGRTGRRDRMEAQSLAFHQKVRRGYLRLSSQEKDRFLVIDACLSRRAIEEIIWKKVCRVLG